MGCKYQSRNAWRAMMYRCYRQSNSDFAYYGGRGITVCDRWHDFSNFLADMGERTSGMTIERIDHNGNYEPSNCRWATRAEQSMNRRCNRVVEHDGATMPLSVMAKVVGMNYDTLRMRLNSGMSVESAITRPIAHSGMRYTVEIGGRSMSLFDACRTLGISIAAIQKRIQAGWTVERALSTPVRAKRRMA